MPERETRIYLCPMTVFSFSDKKSRSRAVWLGTWFLYKGEDSKTSSVNTIIDT